MALFVFRPRQRCFVYYMGWCGWGAERCRVEVHSGGGGELGSGVVCVRRHLGSKPGAVRRAQAGARAPGDRREKPVDGGLPRGIDKASGGFDVCRCVTKQCRAFCIPVVLCELRRNALKTARLFRSIGQPFSYRIPLLLARLLGSRKLETQAVSCQCLQLAPDP